MTNASDDRPGRFEIARNWLPRYTGMPLDKFGDYILRQADAGPDKQGRANDHKRWNRVSECGDHYGLAHCL